MSTRDTLLTLWIGSSLQDCNPNHRGAVTLLGLSYRIHHDIGIEYTTTEIAAACKAEGYWIDDNGKLAKFFESPYTARARGAAASLAGRTIGGK